MKGFRKVTSAFCETMQRNLGVLFGISIKHFKTSLAPNFRLLSQISRIFILMTTAFLIAEYDIRTMYIDTTHFFANGIVLNLKLHLSLNLLIVNWSTSSTKMELQIYRVNDHSKGISSTGYWPKQETDRITENKIKFLSL